MKKFLLIVNTSVFLLFLLLASFFLYPANAQSPTVSPTNSPQSSFSNPLFILQDLLKILFNNTNPPIHNPPIHNPPLSGYPTLPPGNLPTVPPGTANSILGWSAEINARLQSENHIWPPWDYFNVLTNPPSNNGYTARYSPATQRENLYWCTYLVIDAFNLDGKRGLTAVDHSAVLNMIPYFINTPGYNYIPYTTRFINYSASPPSYQITSLAERKQSIATVQPGCATFFQTTPGKHVTNGNHVAILKSKSLDINFNGTIETYDSNNTQKVIIYEVVEGDVKNTPFVTDSLRGFGCPS